MTVGSHDITAQYSGDSGYDPETSPIRVHTVGKASTTTTPSRGSTADPSPFSAPVSFTATVAATSPGTGTPTGTVEFKDGSTVITGCGAVALATGVAGCDAPGLAVASHTITTTYGGDDGYLTSNDTITQVIEAADTTSVLTSSDSSTTSNEAVTYTATIAPVSPATTPPSGGTVEFRIGSTAITGCSAQPVTSGVATCATVSEPVGSPTINAEYSGTSSFNGSVATGITQTVGNADTTTSMAVSPSSGPYVFGDAVTFTATIAPVSPATVSPGVGTVSFNADSAPIAGCETQAVTSGTANCVTDVLPAGSRSVNAAYTGDSGFNDSASSAVGLTISRAESSTVVTSSANPSVFSQSVTFTATVASGGGTPNGTVTFLRAGDPITGCTARTLTAGTTTCTLATPPVGTSSITAVYAASANYLTSTSSATIQSVTKQSTTTVLTSSDATTTRTEPVTFTATITSVTPATATPTGGAVAFKLAGTRITGCRARTVSTGVAICTTTALPVGPALSITAFYSGDAVSATSTSSAFSQAVASSTTRTDLTPRDSPAKAGTTVRFRVIVSSPGEGEGAPTGVVALYRVRDNGSREWIGRVNLRAGVGIITVAGMPVGLHTVVAEYRGTESFKPSHRSARQRIDR